MDIYDDMKAHLRQGGRCILSGILSGQKDDLIRFLRARGVNEMESVEQEGWCRVAFDFNIGHCPKFE